MNLLKTPLLIITLLILSYNTNATNYYVSNSGNDTNNDGLTISMAFATLQHASDLLTAGDTVFIDNGTYVGFDIRNQNGTSGSPIVFKAIGTNAIINQSGPLRNDGINIENSDYIIIDGINANNMTGNGNGIRVVVSDFCEVRNCYCDNNAERGIFTAFADDILIENNICTNSIDEHGIYVSNSSDRPVVRHNECYGNNGAGIHMNGDLSSGGDGIISDAKIYGNILHDNNGAAGINMDGLQSPIVYNNLIYNNHFSQGIVLFQGDGAIITNSAKIYNNTIIVPTDGRWGILVKSGGNINTEIYNNIIINNHSWRGCIAIEDASQFTSNYNLLNDKMNNTGDGSSITLSDWQALGFDTNSILVNSMASLFVNYAAGDYHLLSGSEAIDVGTNLVNSIVTDDLTGISRPNNSTYDIGAYEFVHNNVSIATNTSNQFNVFPNPSSDYFNINLEVTQENIISIKLLDINGKLIKTFNKVNKIGISTISSGIYLLQVELNNHEILTKKVVIK